MGLLNIGLWIVGVALIAFGYLRGARSMAALPGPQGAGPQRRPIRSLAGRPPRLPARPGRRWPWTSFARRPGRAPSSRSSASSSSSPASPCPPRPDGFDARTNRRARLRHPGHPRRRAARSRSPGPTTRRSGRPPRSPSTAPPRRRTPSIGRWPGSRACTSTRARATPPTGRSRRRSPRSRAPRTASSRRRGWPPSRRRSCRCSGAAITSSWAMSSS